ncbi:MAG: hypothetical protein WKG01_08680 [Kofleriaceae bacterium]
MRLETHPGMDVRATRAVYLACFGSLTLFSYLLGTLLDTRAGDETATLQLLRVVITVACCAIAERWVRGVEQPRLPAARATIARCRTPTRRRWVDSTT